MSNLSSIASRLDTYRRALQAVELPRFAPRQNGMPLVIAVEGPNGAGKTTLCSALASTLQAPACLGTDRAWFSDPFRTRMIRDAEWFASAMFFLSGCFEQMRVLRGRTEPVVIMDRSLWSTLAVHAAHAPERLAALVQMLGPVAGQVPVPGVTLVLEASFATCGTRIARKSGPARALDELTAEPGFHAREQEFYRWLAGRAPGVLLLQVDDLDPAEAAQQALALLRPSLPC